MGVFGLRILESARRELAQLDKPSGRRIAERIQWLAEHFDEIKPTALRGELGGLYKLRVGDFRIIYAVRHEEELIIIHAIGHRRDVYRGR